MQKYGASDFLVTLLDALSLLRSLPPFQMLELS